MPGLIANFLERLKERQVNATYRDDVLTHFSHQQKSRVVSHLSLRAYRKWMELAGTDVDKSKTSEPVIVVSTECEGISHTLEGSHEARIMEEDTAEACDISTSFGLINPSRHTVTVSWTEDKPDTAIFTLKIWLD